MSILSKLLGKKAEEAARDLLKGIVNGEQAKPSASQKPTFQQPQPVTRPTAAQTFSGPSGFSWGEEMPNEPNQFNYPGTYRAYFEDIFRTDFSGYRVTLEDARTTAYSFFDGDRKALVVELLAQSSGAYKLREDCRKSGTPYLRFYYDHRGWWNTRSYVVGRIRKALEG